MGRNRARKSMGPHRRSNHPARSDRFDRQNEKKSLMMTLFPYGSLFGVRVDRDGGGSDLMPERTEYMSVRSGNPPDAACGCIAANQFIPDWRNNSIEARKGSPRGGGGLKLLRSASTIRSDRIFIPLGREFGGRIVGFGVAQGRLLNQRRTDMTPNISCPT